VWHLPGRNAISGDHVGWDAIRRDFLDKTGPLSGGTLRAGLVDVAVGEDHLVAVQHATADHNGRTLDVTGCQLIRMENGLIAEVTGHYSDQYAFDAFWQEAR
jgi:ketosteroid isomerase-like protein